MEIGVAPGIRVGLTAGNDPFSRGATIEEALPHAQIKAASETGERRDFLLRWVQAATRQIKNDQLEARIDKQYKKLYEPGEKYIAKLSLPIRDGCKEHIRDQIRQKLKPDSDPE